MSEALRGPSPAPQGVGLGATLVIVESPAKARTLRRWLGPGHQVMATQGHLMDLPEGRLGVAVEGTFEPTYEVLRGKNRLLSDLKRAARSASRVLLATDPDREGEAIAWHLAEALGACGGSPRVRRVLLHELTPDAIREAMAEPRDLDRRRFEAQQARRILDRLVGFQVSPLLWKRVRRGLSAGRVQSVAVRLVTDREREIQGFEPVVSFSIEALLRADWKRPFRAVLLALDGQPPSELRDQASAEATRRALDGAAFTVVSASAVPRVLPPPPPFTTASLQQVAAARLGLSPRRTMALAQRLYEGVALGEEGSVGLISYPRTDSPRIAPSLVEAARRHLSRVHGEAHLPATPNVFLARPGAQAAHEAIRPTALEWPPERVGPFLAAARERDLLRLYRLIWDRFLACQMRPAVREETLAILLAGPADQPLATFAAEGSVVSQQGWLAADEDAEADPDGGAVPGPAAPRLPPLAPGQPLQLEALQVNRRVTIPPPRYSEATLVEALEARGLGRPSTFAAIVDTVQARGYVERWERRLRPTALGSRVTDALVEALPQELDAGFTAGLEAELDRIEEGTAGWRDVVERFHGSLRQALARAEARRGEATDPAVPCPRCGRIMVARWGRGGELLACPGYPVCRHTVDARREGGVLVPTPPAVEDAGALCPRCGGPTVARRGRHGPFLGCARYPACDGARAPSLGLDCPLGCGGEVVAGRSRRGQAFFHCTGGPACAFVSWHRPRGEPCPDCGGTYLVEVRSRRLGSVLSCPDGACGYRRPAVDGPPERLPDA